MMRRKKIFVLAFALLSSVVTAEQAYDLNRLEAMALESSRNLLAVRDQVAVARAAVDTASAFPNPELEYMGGSVRPRGVGGPSGDARSVTLTQPLDLPWRRAVRVAAAEAGLDSAVAGGRSVEVALIAQLRVRYFELLRRQAELRNAREDVALVESVRSRIEKRVETGDAPKFELIKADAEMLNAQKASQAASVRVEQARSLLRQMVGATLPADFVVSGSLRDVRELPPIEKVRQGVASGSPDLARARAETVRAERQLELERSLRWPNIALKAGMEQDPDVRDSRLGVVVSIPLWDRRRGPVGEAAAQLSRARNELAAQEFALGQTLEVAYQQYEIAQAQVSALESGIVRQAEAALKVAEAAYRFGERGFLEVIDAQRVFRAARAELITARYELAAAWVEVEKLRALPAGKAP